MLKIRESQIDILKSSLIQQYIERTRKYIKEEFNAFYQTHTDIEGWIYNCYIEAKSFGMATEREHIKYLNYKCIFGERFMDEYDFANDILNSKASANVKLADLKYAFLENLRMKN